MKKWENIKKSYNKEKIKKQINKKNKVNQQMIIRLIKILKPHKILRVNRNHKEIVKN